MVTNGSYQSVSLGMAMATRATMTPSKPLGMVKDTTSFCLRGVLRPVVVHATELVVWLAAVAKMSALSSAKLDSGVDALAGNRIESQTCLSVTGVALSRTISMTAVCADPVPTTTSGISGP